MGFRISKVTVPGHPERTAFFISEIRRGVWRSVQELDRWLFGPGVPLEVRYTGGKKPKICFRSLMMSRDEEAPEEKWVHVPDLASEEEFLAWLKAVARVHRRS